MTFVLSFWCRSLQLQSPPSFAAFHSNPSSELYPPISHAASCENVTQRVSTISSATHTKPPYPEFLSCLPESRLYPGFAGAAKTRRHYGKVVAVFLLRNTKTFFCSFCFLGMLKDGAFATRKKSARICFVLFLPLCGGMAHCRGDLPKSSPWPTCATTRPPIQLLTTPTYLYLL